MTLYRGIHFLHDKFSFAPIVLPVAPLPGETRGRIRMLSPGLGADVVPFASTVGTFVAGGSALPPGAAGIRPGVLLDLTVGANFLNRIHILPREEVAFGRFVSPVSRPFEVFNAHSTPVVFEAVANDSPASLELPGTPTVPTLLLPFSSLLDPSSVPLAPVKLRVVTIDRGPPLIDAAIVFSFSTGEVLELDVTGECVAPMLLEPDDVVIEHLEFATSVMPMPAGDEQRVSYRKRPRQWFEVQYLLKQDSQERRRWANLLFARHPSTIAMPLWHESAQLSAAVSAGGTALTIVSTNFIDFRVGGFALAFHDDDTFDVLPIQSVTGTQVVLSEALAHGYGVGDLVMPVRFVQLDASFAGGRYPVGLVTHSFRARVIDNDTGAPDGSTAGLHTLDGRVFFDYDNVMFQMPGREAWAQPITTLDGDAGLVYQTSDADRTKHSIQIGMSPKSRTELWALRLFLLAMRGRFTSFWIPNRMADLIATQTLASGSNEITVENDHYTAYVQARQHQATLRVTLVVGTQFIRNVVSSVELSETEEVLTLDGTWPGNIQPSDIARIEWIECVRFDADDVILNHTQIGRATIQIPAVVVRDVG